jgi:hypothetical protein
MRATQTLDRMAFSRRVGPTLLCAALLTAGWAIPAVAADAKPSAAATPATKTVKKKKKKAAAPAQSAAEKPETLAAKRRRYGAEPVYLVGDGNAHMINQNAPKIVAFPHEAQAVEKAFSETRRDQLVDAERSAREAKTPDRWRTVLFMLRGLQERTDPEACFWRVLSFYRLGEIDRARAVRESCDLPAKDSSVLNNEDATAAGVPAMGTVARQDQFYVPAGATEPGKKDSDPSAPPAGTAPPYTGPGPQRYK